MKAIFSCLEDTLNVFEGTRVTEDRTMMQSEWAVSCTWVGPGFSFTSRPFSEGAKGLTFLTIQS